MCELLLVTSQIFLHHLSSGHWKTFWIIQQQCVGGGGGANMEVLPFDLQNMPYSWVTIHRQRRLERIIRLTTISVQSWRINDKQKLNYWLFHIGLEMIWSGLIYICKMNIRLSNMSSGGHKRLRMLESVIEKGEQLVRQQRKSAAEDLDWDLFIWSHFNKSSQVKSRHVHNLNMHAGIKVRVRDGMHVQIVHINKHSGTRTQVCGTISDTLCVYEQTLSHWVTNAFCNPFLILS